MVVTERAEVHLDETFLHGDTARRRQTATVVARAAAMERRRRGRCGGGAAQRVQDQQEQDRGLSESSRLPIPAWLTSAQVHYNLK